MTRGKLRSDQNFEPSILCGKELCSIGASFKNKNPNTMPPTFIIHASILQFGRFGHLLAPSCSTKIKSEVTPRCRQAKPSTAVGWWELIGSSRLLYSGRSERSQKNKPRRDGSSLKTNSWDGWKTILVPFGARQIFWSAVLVPQRVREEKWFWCCFCCWKWWCGCV